MVRRCVNNVSKFVWTINTVSTLCHVLGCLDDHEHLACLGALVRAKREDETRLEST